jgi:hypothetical protein
LLAVMTAVKEYGRTLTKGQGAQAGDIETFIEVEFDLDGKKVVPDRLIRVSRGSRVWGLFAFQRGDPARQWVHAARRAALVSRIRAW